MYCCWLRFRLWCRTHNRKTASMELIYGLWWRLRPLRYISCRKARQCGFFLWFCPWLTWNGWHSKNLWENLLPTYVVFLMIVILRQVCELLASYCYQALRFRPSVILPFSFEPRSRESDITLNLTCLPSHPTSHDSWMSTSSERSQWNKHTRFLNTNGCGFTLTNGWKQEEMHLHVYVSSPFKQSTPRFWMMDEITAISTPRQNSSRAEGTTKLTRRFRSASNLTHTWYL